jgi:hypothetical protein
MLYFFKHFWNLYSGVTKHYFARWQLFIRWLIFDCEPWQKIFLQTGDKARKQSYDKRVNKQLNQPAKVEKKWTIWVHFSTLIYSTLSCPVLPCPALAYPLLPCPTLPCPVVPCTALFCPVMSSPVVCCYLLLMQCVLTFIQPLINSFAGWLICLLTLLS